MVINLAIGHISRKVYLFSGYEFNEYENQTFHCYANEHSSGVANITSDLALKMISDVRYTDPSAYIIISPHWGG